MKQQKSMGTCALCGKRFARAAMTLHLKSCGSRAAGGDSCIHLFVEARYNKLYWMHLAVPLEATLKKLDAFLRNVWLECCGHLSAFRIAGEEYSSQPMRDFGQSGMGAKLDRVLYPGIYFFYEYDFGSTTELSLKVIGVRDQVTKKGAIELLARNDAPQFPCERCGNQPATQICTECVNQDEGWLCETCAADHECGGEMLLPVVNSPRAGVCGYSG